jgi:hypothetical protein
MHNKVSNNANNVERRQFDTLIIGAGGGGLVPVVAVCVLHYNWLKPT